MSGMKRAQLLICLWDRMVPGITTAQLALVEPDLNANVGSPARILQKQSFANRVQPESLRRIGGHGIADAASPTLPLRAAGDRQVQPRPLSG